MGSIKSQPVGQLVGEIIILIRDNCKTHSAAYLNKRFLPEQTRSIAGNFDDSVRAYQTQFARNRTFPHSKRLKNQDK